MATLDLTAVRRFTDDLDDRLRRCDNGEGMYCSTLDASIKYYVDLCGSLTTCVHGWARAVFASQIGFDPEVEAVLKQAAQHLLHRAKEKAALGRTMNGQCFELQGLPALHYCVADLDYLLDNWVSPRPAVSPAPRVKLTDAAAQQVVEGLDKLPALPADWRPSQPAQLALFQSHRAK